MIDAYKYIEVEMEGKRYIYLFRGDSTHLAVFHIVNEANKNIRRGEIVVASAGYISLGLNGYKTRGGSMGLRIDSSESAARLLNQKFLNEGGDYSVSFSGTILLGTKGAFENFNEYHQTGSFTVEKEKTKELAVLYRPEIKTESIKPPKQTCYGHRLGEEIEKVLNCGNLD